MKRLHDAWGRVTAFENLYEAWRRARAGKRQRADVAAFDLNLEVNLLTLQAQLRDQSWRPGPYRQFCIYEGKPRLISAAPFVDRVVHHALMAVVEPFLDGKFIHDSYACRPGKGVHKAVDRYQRWSRCFPYVMKLDIARYFFSISHQRLKEKLSCCIADPHVLWLFEQIIDSSPPVAEPLAIFAGDDWIEAAKLRCGIPIGNLTSQILANLYLHDMDEFIKRRLGVKGYLRYVDDFFLFADNKAQLHQWGDALGQFLVDERLRIHPRKINVMPVRVGVDVLGYRVWPTHRRLRAGNVSRFRRRLRAMQRSHQAGLMSLDDIKPRVASWIGHAAHAQTWRLREQIFSGVVFSNGR